MTTKRTGRPPKHTNGAMTEVIRFRAQKRLVNWLDSKGNRSQAARDILRRAMDEESEAANAGNECKTCGEKGTGAGFCINCGGDPR